jgi:hypothetical protein
VYKLFKGLAALGFICTLLAAGSYAGTHVTAGRILGPSRPLTNRASSFSFAGVEQVNDRRFVWIVHFAASRLPGVKRATLYISPTGRLLAMRPPDLDARLDAWERSRNP